MSIQEKVRPLRLDRSRHAAPQVLEHLRDLILDLQLAPGTVLPRAELAERFGVSQTPIRDALMRLDEEGLVEVYPQHATIVSRINIGLAQQAHFLRRSLELEIVRTLALAPAADLIAKLRGYIDLQQSLLGSTDYRDFVAADQAFHQYMYEAANVGNLWQLVRRMSGHLDRLRRLHLPVPGKAEAVLRDHRRIVDAIAKKNPDVAQERLREHLSGTLSQIEEIRRRYPDFVAE